MASASRELALWDWLKQRQAEHLHLNLLRLKFEDQEVESSLTLLKDLARWSDRETGYSLQHMMSSDNWRHHVLAIGAILSTSERAHQHTIESRIQEGSMVAPQLIAALGLLHKEQALSFLQMQAQNDEPDNASSSEAARCILFWMNQTFVEQTYVRPDLMRPRHDAEDFRGYLEETLKHYRPHPFAQSGVLKLADIEHQRRLGVEVATTYIAFWESRLY